jgi:hypothetical protein
MEITNDACRGAIYRALDNNRAQNIATNEGAINVGVPNEGAPNEGAINRAPTTDTIGGFAGEKNPMFGQRTKGADLQSVPAIV